MTTKGTVSTSINAGPIQATGNGSPEVGRQITMGHNFFIHIQPEMARQWIEVLETVAESESE